MKKITLILLTAILFIACKTEKKQEVKVIEQPKNEIAAVTSQMMETAVIYEANIRQYSKEGTFDAFTKDIPEIKKLGAKIIWLMPVFPISETKRKATGDKFVSDIKDENERKKYLGSYYAVSDFTKVNPEFGTMDDLRKLIKIAHQNGIYVILDWVPNHTGWDHPWIKNHPEYYNKNKKGEITDPLNNDGKSMGWTDVADLNYDSNGLRKAMINDMTYWLKNENIDGFRCDVAGSVPVDFWQEAIPQLRKEKDIFMLAEAWEPELLKGNLFDMAYGWGTHHRMNEIAQGKADVSAWDNRMKEISTMYEADDILMNFITNHDENSWNGTVNERLGSAAKTMLALSYVAPGMPLIYSGEEYGLDHRLKFFEKDEIPKTKGKMWTLLEKLGKLKNTSSALNGGKNAASYKRIETNNKNILVFERSKNGSTITFIANLSDKKQALNNVIKGRYLDYIENSELELTQNKLTLNPWEYKILIH